MGRDQLDALWRAVHGERVPEQVLRVFDVLVPHELEPRGWPSFVSDDHTPYELSLLLGGETPEIRVMAESLPREGPVTLAGTIAAGRETSKVLARDFGANTTRLEAIADLFLDDPERAEGPFALWHAAAFDASGSPHFKCYVSPHIRGKANAPRLVEEMLDRLEFPGAWGTITRSMGRGPRHDDLRFVSLDLGDESRARVKIYGFHHDPTPEYLANVASAAPGSDPDAIAAFCRTMAGGDGILRAPRQPGSCLAFVGGESVPRTCTIYIPVCAFAGSDRDANERIRQAMTALELPTHPSDNAIEALAGRPLEDGSGFLPWVGLRTGRTAPKMNVYLAPRVLSDQAPHPTVKPVEDTPEAILEEYEREPITDHPLFRRLAREPFDIRRMTLLLLNVQRAITRDFTRRLASVVARVEEDSIRSILAKQLNDELGDGDPTRMHKLLFDKLIAGLGEWAPAELDDGLLEPGRRLGEVLEEIYVHRSPYEGVGATLPMEALGKQVDFFWAEQFRRMENALPASVLEWLTLHEELEMEHADETLELVRLIPRGTKERLAVRGARELTDEGWRFYDGIYELCYS